MDLSFPSEGSTERFDSGHPAGRFSLTAGVTLQEELCGDAPLQWVNLGHSQGKKRPRFEALQLLAKLNLTFHGVFSCSSEGIKFLILPFLGSQFPFAFCLPFLLNPQDLP